MPSKKPQLPTTYITPELEIAFNEAVKSSRLSKSAFIRTCVISGMRSTGEDNA